MVLRVGFVGLEDIVTHLVLKCPGGYSSRGESVRVVTHNEVVDPIKAALRCCFEALLANKKHIRDVHALMRVGGKCKNLKYMVN